MLIVVPSCISFSDTWSPFAALLRRFWRDLPQEWPLHLLTDGRPDEALAAGDGTVARDFDFLHAAGAMPSWSARLRWLLASQLPGERVVLMLQDDMFLMGAPHTAAVRAAAELVLRGGDIGSVRLNPCPGPADEFPVAEVAGVPLGLVKRGEPYRVSCQATVWRSDFLARGLACVPANERSPSDFEYHATRAAEHWTERVLCVPRSYGNRVLPHFTTAIISGKWHPDALALCAREGVAVKSTRPVMEAARP